MDPGSARGALDRDDRVRRLTMIEKIKRFFKILKVIFKYRLLWSIKMVASGESKNDLIKAGANLKNACEELGVLFIKLGQILSTRFDLLPVEVTQELRKLQDSVKPFDPELVKAKIREDFGKEYNRIFTSFSDEPLAAASVAQVHTAKLNNQDVVIKILRPNLQKIIAVDLKLLKLLIKIISVFYSDIKRVNPSEQIAELERILTDEQDLLREAANASQLRRTFADSKLITIPKVYWDYCSKNILVLERIYGISINDIDTLKKYNVDLKLLAKNGVELFFTQVFEHCLFHGDMHPGNIFVNINPPFSPSNPSFYAVDFGIMGTLGPKEQYFLACNLWAFINRDYRKIAELHIESGWVPSDTRVDVFEAAIRAVSEPILERNISEVSFGQMFTSLFEVAKKFELQIQPQLLLFKKALINVESMARQLDPQLDLWSVAKPYTDSWVEKKIGVGGIVKKIRDNLPVWAGFLMDYPEMSLNFVKSMTKNYLKS